MDAELPERGSCYKVARPQEREQTIRAPDRVELNKERDIRSAVVTNIGDEMSVI